MTTALAELELDKEVCDASCPAKAQVTYMMPDGKLLLFCQHHANQNHPKLLEQNARKLHEWSN